MWILGLKGLMINYAGELLGTSGFFLACSGELRPRKMCKTWPKPETALEKPSAFSLLFKKKKFERNSSQEYYDITYIGKTYKLSRSVFPCEIFVLSKLSSLSHLS